MRSRTFATWALLIAVGFSSTAFAQWYARPELYRSVRVVHVVLDDNGDGDGWADSNETVAMRVRFLNATQIDLAHLSAHLTSDDPSVECITRPFIFIGDVAAGEQQLSGAAFEFKLADVDRPADGSSFTAAFTIRFSADEYGGPIPGFQEIVIELDLDTDGESAATTFLESFENGLGSFEPQPIDEALNPPDSDLENNLLGVINADGYRCQYSDPDWENSNSSGSSQSLVCFPNPNNTPDTFWWTTTTDRAFSGSHALSWNAFLNPALGFSTPTAQLEAVRSSEPIDLAPTRTCADSGLACAEDSDCAEGEICRPPTLSFKHQISMLDHRSISGNADRGIVQAQVADASGTPSGPWIKLQPYINVYDTLPNSNYFNCSFDPIDDGNTEEDFFDPDDPQRRFGPSSTCAPGFNFVDQGETGMQFDPLNLGDASEGPGLQGIAGLGTWVEPQFDLDRFRGQRVRLRFLASSLKLGAALTWESAFVFNPDPRDDGWFIDDVKVTGAVESSVAIGPDDKDNTHLPILEDLDEDALTCENCPFDANADQADADGDGIGDACDDCPNDFANDHDADGFCCDADNCCDLYNPLQVDDDQDGVGDRCDNCLTVSNPTQADVIHPEAPATPATMLTATVCSMRSTIAPISPRRTPPTATRIVGGTPATTAP